MVTLTAPAPENDAKRHKKKEAEYPPIPTTTALARPPRTKNSYMHPDFLNMAALAADWQLHRSVSKYCRLCFPIADEQHQNDTKRNPNTQMFTQSVASITSRMSRRVAMSCFVVQSTNQTDCGHEFENWRHDFSWDALQVIARLLPAAGCQEHKSVETTTILGM